MKEQELPLMPREVVVTTIATLRKVWELEAIEDSLISVRASVGFLLADIVIGLGFTPREQEASLGTQLFRELEIAGVLATGNEQQIIPAESLEWIPENWVISE